MASLHSCTIACHLELKEYFDNKVVTELKEEIMKHREAHSREICSLEEKVNQVEDKYSIKEKEGEA